MNREINKEEGAGTEAVKIIQRIAEYFFVMKQVKIGEFIKISITVSNN
jgi:hypothetical protein